MMLLFTRKRLLLALLVVAFVAVTPAKAAGFCNWGSDGTGSSSVCKGGAQGGAWCNAKRSQCESGCGGRWCTTGGSAPAPTRGPVNKPTPSSTSGRCPDGWTPASWTTYTSYAPCCQNSPNYDPNADRTECDYYSACDYSGDFAYVGHKSYNWVKNNNIVAMFSTTNNASYGNKRIRISAKGKTMEAQVVDTCGDGDCNGCCTTNAQPSGYLIDMEYWTVVRNFQDISAASGQICWQLV